MGRFLTALGHFISRYWILVMAVSLLLMVAAVFGARNVSMATGTRTIISPQSDILKDYEKYGENFGSDPIVVLITAEDVRQLLENLPAMDRLETELNQKENVISAMGPAFALQQAIARQTGSPSLPADARAIEAMLLDPATGQLRPQVARLFPQGKYAIIRVTPRGNLEREALRAVVDEVTRAVEKAGFNNNVTIKITGMPAATTKIQDMMRTSMRDMILLAALLMVLVLAVIFHVRGFFTRRWLALGVVLVGIVYTFGVMGMLGVPLTMVSMAVFPILIGLGIDYGIQFHARYDEEVRKGEAPAEAVATSLRHMAPALGIAVFATCLGFAALFISPVTMIRDFGRMLLIGVGVCYVTAMFLLLSILYWRDRRVTSSESATTGEDDPHNWLERRLRKLAPVVIRHPLTIILAALALTVAGFVADQRVATETDELKFVSQETPEIKELLTLQGLVGGIMTANVMVEAPDITDPSVIGWMLALEQGTMEQHGDTVAGASGLPDLVLQANAGKIPENSAQVRAILDGLPLQMKANLINEDYTLANVSFTLRDVDIDKLRKFKDDIAPELEDRPDGMQAVLTGRPIVMIEMYHALTSGRLEMMLLGAALIFGGLLVVFRRNWLRAVFAVLPIGLIVGWSGGMMYLLGVKYTPLTATLGALIIGIGSEFTILLMMRYYEERGKGESPFEAMSTAMTRIGRAILASGVAVIAGFGALLASGQFPILRDFGIVTMIDVTFALLSTLVVLPPLIVWVDSWRQRHRPAMRTV